MKAEISKALITMPKYCVKHRSQWRRRWVKQECKAILVRYVAGRKKDEYMIRCRQFGNVQNKLEREWLPCRAEGERHRADNKERWEHSLHAVAWSSTKQTRNGIALKQVRRKAHMIQQMKMSTGPALSGFVLRPRRIHEVKRVLSKWFRYRLFRQALQN